MPRSTDQRPAARPAARPAGRHPRRARPGGGADPAVDPLRHAVSAALRGDSAEVRARSTTSASPGRCSSSPSPLVHAVVFYPAEIVDAAAGFAYGFFPALRWSGGWVLSGLLCCAIGRRVARPLLDRWLGTERFERTEAMIERGGVTLLLSVRLVPIVPFSLVSYAAGAARVPLWRFIWTTAVGYLPITAIAVYSAPGSRALPHRPSSSAARRAAGAARRRPLDRPAGRRAEAAAGAAYS